jgi:hypothetical protein
VEYEYSVNGLHYTNDTIAQQAPYSTAQFERPPSDRLLALQSSLAQGSQVDVWYDPMDPRSSILIKTRRFPPIIFFVGLIMLGGFSWIRRSLD